MKVETDGPTFWWGYGSGLVCGGLLGLWRGHWLTVVIVGAVFMVFALLSLGRSVGTRP